jgi:DNA-binding transcriptional ArsR family regulator
LKPRPALAGKNYLTFCDYLYNYIVMEQYDYIPGRANLDAVFHALADSTRRAILSRLADGQASVNEIAAPFDISQPAVSRHLKVLERAGLVERDIDEQRRPARLRADNLAIAVNWLADFRPMWGTSFNELDDLLIQMKKKNRSNKSHE